MKIYDVDKLYEKYDREDEKRRVRESLAKSERVRRDSRGRVVA